MADNFYCSVCKKSHKGATRHEPEQIIIRGPIPMMADKEWRPVDWDKLSDCAHIDEIICTDHSNCDICRAIFEAGASAMHKAVIKYLQGKCTDHQDSNLETINDDGEFITVLLDRKDCPSCMRQLQESANNG